MKFDLQKLVPEHIRNLQPYQSARMENVAPYANQINLDANELPFAFEDMPSDINRYPREEAQKLKEAIEAIKGLDKDQIYLSNGSDESIDLLMRCFARPGQDEVVEFAPTFGMYKVRAQANNLKAISLPLSSTFEIDPEAAMEATTPNTKMLFVCNPNNPTGNCQSRETIIHLLDHFSGLVIVDEAYVDFCPEESCLPLLNQYPNLVVLQTFSKAWGLAGARIGMTFASREIIAYLEKTGFPYNVGRPALDLANRALNRFAEYRMNVATIQQQRSELAQKLQALPFVEKVYPSAANFLLVKTSAAGKIYNILAQKGILVRDRSREPGCEGCLRITVGSREENNALLKALGQGNGQREKPAAVRAIDVPERTASVHRKTAETDIALRLNLDGKGRGSIRTGIGFLDHMLHQIARHGMVDLDVEAMGDLQVDVHHTLEDTAICLGQALKQALGNKRGIKRYGFELPMDESNAKVLMDLGGRSYLKWDVEFMGPAVGAIPSSLFSHFFRSLSEAASMNLHITARGEDDHHQVEAVFKAFARTLGMAKSRDASNIMPSTKETL